MTAEIKGQYVEGLDKPDFYSFIQSQTPAAKFVTDYSVRWIFLMIAIFLILATYLPDLVSSRFDKKYFKRQS
jgi:mxaL protein